LSLEALDVAAEAGLLSALAPLLELSLLPSDEFGDEEGMSPTVALLPLRLSVM
jgi:hypothetical protein